MMKKFTILFLALVFVFLKSFGSEPTSFPILDHPLQITLSFGDKLKMDGELSDEVTWSISLAGEFIHEGRGVALLDFVFEQPGIYVVQMNENVVHDPADCGHKNLPSEIQITVSSRKLVFDFENATFSSSISSGNISGLTLSVPVIVDSYDGSTFLFEQEEVKTAGVGSNITAVPVDDEIMLSPGTHILKYTITGGVERPTFVMFDFVDINGIVQSFSITQEIH